MTDPHYNEQFGDYQRCREFTLLPISRLVFDILSTDS